MNKVTVGVLATLIFILMLSGLLAYLSHSPAPVSTPSESAKSVDENQHKNPLLWELFGPDASGLVPTSYTSWEATAARILLRFSLAAFLAGLLAFRPRRGLSFSRRNPFVAQTQILMGVVAAAMMMVVGDSAARAFGIFAAASLVRFRTNIRDPKEITVLLICLGVGLACGVGRLDMALILTVFVLAVLWILEHFESAQIFRSMEMRIETRNLDQTRHVLQRLFERHGFIFEVRQLERGGEEGEHGKIVYELSLGYADTTDKLSEEIFCEDADNIAALEWEQKKSSTYIYN